MHVLSFGKAFLFASKVGNYFATRKKDMICEATKETGAARTFFFVAGRPVTNIIWRASRQSKDGFWKFAFRAGETPSSAR